MCDLRAAYLASFERASMDHRADGSGLDDGPPLPRACANGPKKDRAIELRRKGKTLRAIADELGGITFETVRVWTRGVSKGVEHG